MNLLLALLFLVAIAVFVVWCFRSPFESDIQDKNVDITINFRDGSSTALVDVEAYNITFRDLRIMRDGHTFIFDRYEIRSIAVTRRK